MLLKKGLRLLKKNNLSFLKNMKNKHLARLEQDKKRQEYAKRSAEYLIRIATGRADRNKRHSV
jgi:hypothetical protein